MTSSLATLSEVEQARRAFLSECVHHMMLYQCSECSTFILTRLQQAARDEGLEMAAKAAEGLGPIDYTADSQAGGWNEALRQSAAAIRALSRVGKERG